MRSENKFGFDVVYFLFFDKIFDVVYILKVEWVEIKYLFCRLQLTQLVKSLMVV